MPGWREMPKDADGVYIDSDDWDVVWSDRGWVRDNFDGMRLTDTQRVNHFRNNYELTRKDHMAKNIKRYKKQLEREGNYEEAACFDFAPTTYTVPSEYGLFYEEFKRNANSTWIMKPVGSAQGRGIFLFTKLSQIDAWKKDCAQTTPPPPPAARWLRRHCLPAAALVAECCLLLSAACDGCWGRLLAAAAGNGCWLRQACWLPAMSGARRAAVPMRV